MYISLDHGTWKNAMLNTINQLNQRSVVDGLPTTNDGDGRRFQLAGDDRAVLLFSRLRNGRIRTRRLVAMRMSR